MKEAIKVGISGVRGIVGDSFTPQIAMSFAQAFGNFVGRGPVLIARDTRPTGLMVEYAVVAGLQSVGCKPILLGMIPTPTLLFLTKTMGARGGVAITASHNPTEWNALKFVDRTGLFLDAIQTEEFLDIYHQRDFHLVPEADILEVSREENPVHAHWDKIKLFVDWKTIQKQKFKVAVDCCNGVGALHSARFLHELLGCEVIAIFDKPSGVFEREPELAPAHLSQLCATIRKHHCQVGFAQDPDGDRLAVVDEDGNPLGEESSVGLAILQVLEQHQLGPVVVNSSTSRGVAQAVLKHNVRFLYSKTGEIHVVKKMLETGAVVGGESSGGVIIPAIHPCRDSYAAMAIVLERMALTGKTPSQLRSEIPRYHLRQEKLQVHGEQAPRILRAIRKKYQNEKINTEDGVLVEFEDRWLQVRRSNTEPIVRLMVEAPTAEQAERMIQELRSEIDQIN